MPVMLVFETVQDRIPPLSWSYRRTIDVPGEDASGRRVVAHYDIMARAMHQTTPAHFTAYIRHGLNHCYLYDDTQSGGLLQRQEQKVAVDMLIAGKIDPIVIGEGENQKTLSTNSVVYHLREGSMGQDWISRGIRNRIERIFNVSIVNVDGAHFPRVTLTRPSEVLVKRAEDQTKHDEYETRLNADPPPQSTYGEPVEVLQNEGIQNRENIITDAPRHRVEKPWPFPPIELSDKETDIVSVHSDKANTERVSHETRTKLAQRVSQASSSDVSVGRANIFRCRCGFEGEEWDWNLDQNIIQCNNFDSSEGKCLWSHSACQLDGWTHSIGPKDPFFCPTCWPLHWSSKTGLMSNEQLLQQSKLPLSLRLRPGLGVLVRLGTFWYPGRVIDCPGEREMSNESYMLYTVRMWRGCEFDEEAKLLIQGLLAKITIDDIVDCLWRASKQRKEVRIGKFTHAKIGLDNDLDNFQEYPYTDDIDNILSPHTDALLTMISRPSGLDLKQTPVIAYLQKNVNGYDSISRANIKRGSVSLPGDVLLEDQARIVNWLVSKVQSILSKPPAQSTPLEMEVQSRLSNQKLQPMTSAQARHTESAAIQLEVIGTAVLAHAITLFISATRHLSLEKAFEIQSSPSSKFKVVDVDRECLSVLEDRMFNAGEEDWGMDSGSHQGNWD